MRGSRIIAPVSPKLAVTIVASEGGSSKCEDDAGGRAVESFEKHARATRRVADSAIAIGTGIADLTERRRRHGLPGPFENRRAGRRRDRYTQDWSDIYGSPWFCHPVHAARHRVLHLHRRFRAAVPCLRPRTRRRVELDPRAARRRRPHGGGAG